MRNYYKTAPRPFRKIPANLYPGLDSIQGFLEWAQDYEVERHYGITVAVPEDIDQHDSITFTLKQLSNDGDISITFLDSDAEGWGGPIDQMSLTPQGHKHLDDLIKKSYWWSLRTRLVNLLWIVVASSVTTVVVLEIRGL